MKNNIIGLFLLLCTLNIQSVSAQRHYRPEISVGVKFGTNLSNTTFQPKVQEGGARPAESGRHRPRAPACDRRHRVA